ncbi:unnamed protein product [Cyclocybe aegerita]|uniref:Uncharacterized protein n=1 Tax=Cyclocybe aegerita TaxID=1973307 RepID=A0A8S0WUQ0_CYCAE|nr:unnamed protein product [Cyclocybe aegerita]
MSSTSTGTIKLGEEGGSSTTPPSFKPLTLPRIHPPADVILKEKLRTHPDLRFDLHEGIPRPAPSTFLLEDLACRGTREEGANRNINVSPDSLSVDLHFMGANTGTRPSTRSSFFQTHAVDLQPSRARLLVGLPLLTPTLVSAAVMPRVWKGMDDPLGCWTEEDRASPRHE